MVHPSVDELKANAFALSKILATYKVKLSSQQCLDVLARLTWNSPYEAVVTQGRAATEQASIDEEAATIDQWFATAQAFCDLLATLDREGVNGAAFNGHKVPDGLHWDGRTYLKAAGAAAASFSRSARSFVESELVNLPAAVAKQLWFRVEPDEPIVSACLATLRVQNPGDAVSKSHCSFDDIDWICSAEPLLFGAEGRIELKTFEPASQSRDEKAHKLVPEVLVTYEVCGQGALKAFGEVLRGTSVEELWRMVPMEVETHILLTKDHRQNATDEDWQTKSAGAKERLVRFCEHASTLSDEETKDWPPYLTLTKRLDRKSTDQDLRLAFTTLCLHVALMRGNSGGWHEIMEDVRRHKTKGH